MDTELRRDPDSLLLRRRAGLVSDEELRLRAFCGDVEAREILPSGCRCVEEGHGVGVALPLRVANLIAHLLEQECRFDCTDRQRWWKHSLAKWLDWLKRVAWAPALRVACEDYGTGCHAPGGHCGVCNGTGYRDLQPSSIQWTLVAAACGAARMVLPIMCPGQEGFWTPDNDACDCRCGYSLASHVREDNPRSLEPRRAIEAAEAWLAEPTEAWRSAVRRIVDAGHGTSRPDWWWQILRAVYAWDGAGRQAPQVAVEAAAQILGPDATRRAAAAGVLRVIEPARA